MTFSKINAWLHLWLGLISGIGVVILGLTGCILVFEYEIKSLSSPWLHAENSTGGQILPPSLLYKSVEKTFPGREIESVWYKGANRTAHFRLHEMDSTVYVNPYDATVVAAVPNDDIFQFIKDGHYYFWFPDKIGHQLTGWTTFVFFLITISGLILWWPKKWSRKTREQAFTIKWRAKLKRVNYDLHNVLGFYSLLLALLIAATALMMSFAWFNNGVNWLAGAGPEKPRIKALSDTTTHIKTDLLAQMDKAYHKGVHELAEHNPQEVIVTWPEKPSDPFYICTDMYRGTWRDVYLDQYTLQVLPGSDNRLRDESTAEWINRSNYGLHVGAFADMYTKIPYFLASLICASLPITGFYIWWGKKRKQWRKTKKGQKPGTVRLMPVLILFFVLIFSGLSAFAQGPGKINGKAIDTAGTPLEYISIALLLEDGKVVKGVLSDSAGRFSLAAVPYGKYSLKVSGLGYQALTTAVFAISAEQQKLDLGLLKLKEDSKLLNAVMVTAQKKLIEQGIDRTVINIENSILAEGNTALELLERAPGVKVDEEGQISLKGRPGVMVMINGKQTYLSPKELAMLLKGTNSTSISKIEIMSNPSAKFDAAGNGGIINIQMKKNTATGLNGTASVNGGAGRNARYGSGLNLNYRSSRINTYGSYDYGYRGETEYLDFVRRFYNGGAAGTAPDRTSLQHTSTNEPLHTHNFRAGLDVDLSKNNTLGFLLNGNAGKYTHDSKTGNRLVDPAGGLLSNMQTSNYDQQSWQNLTYNLNFQHKFKKEGRELTADADYASNEFTSRLNLTTVTDQAAAGQTPVNLVRRGYVPAVTDVYVAKIDYTDPLTKTAKLETGLKSSFIQSDNNLRYDLLENGSWVYDTNGSNHFKYKEQIHAAYLNFNKDFGMFSIQAGLRAERTETEGHQITSDSLIKRNYTQLFPSVFLSKPLGKEHQLQLAYSRRIERPDYGDLNPFRVFRDPLLFYQGNPFLQPELIHTFQLSHSFRNNYTTSLSCNRTSNVMTWINGQIDELNTTFETPQNLKSLVNYSLSFTASTSFFNWWSGSHFANVFRNEYSGGESLSSFNTAATSFSFNTQNAFKAGKGYSLELNALYNGASVYGISRYRGYYMVSGGAQKQVFNGKGSIKLLINDVFQSKQFRETTRFQNIDMNSHVMLDSRRAILSFSYRFGNQNLGSKERRTGSEDIQNRVKGGG